jgi:hypothetical protein
VTLIRSSSMGLFIDSMMSYFQGYVAPAVN